MKMSVVYLENERHTFTRSIIQLLIILLICCHRGRTDGQIRNLRCVNDYDQEMVCSWETMDLQTNCTTKYQLFYERDLVPLPFNSCVPENLKNNCACTFYVPKFHVADKYTIQIKSDGVLLHEEIFEPAINIKPKTPGNLTVVLNRNGDYILRWDKKYGKEDFLYNHLFFEIFWYNKNDPSENFNFTSNKKETCFEISRSQLKSDSEYAAKTRTGVKDYAGYWSDFSNEVQWRSERTNDSFTPSLFFICFLIVPLVIICYWGIRVFKKKNWDMIPDPSKSNILFTVVGKSEVSENLHSYSKNSSDKKQSHHLKVTHSRWQATFAPCLFNREFTRHHVPKTMGSQTTNGSLKMFESGFPKNESERNLREKANILVPECIIVEPFIVVGKLDDVKADEQESQGEDQQESDTADVLFCNSSINEMFHDLLGISRSPLENMAMVRDESSTSDNSEKDKALKPKTNTQSPIVFSFFCETNQPSKDEGSSDCTLYSPKQSIESCESGYRSFESEVDHVEPKIYAEAMPIYEAQSIPINQNGTCHIEEVANAPELDFDSQYHSFSSAVSQYKNQAGESGETHGAWPTTSLAKVFANNPLAYNTDQAKGSDTNLQFQNYDMGSDCQSVYPQNAIKHEFSFWEGEQDLLLLPNIELFAEITQFDVSSVPSKMDSETFFDPSGYKSFENAVKQDVQC